MNCTKRRTDGQPCQRPAIKGRDACPKHVGEKLSAAKAKGRLVLTAREFGFNDAELPGVDVDGYMLRLTAGSYRQARMYQQLLAEAYDAAERLRDASPASLADDELPPHTETATDRERALYDLQRVFRDGGVSVLIGAKYAAAGKDGDLYQAEEGIRALVDLWNTERDRAFRFSKECKAANLDERLVQLAEGQGALVADVLRGVLADLGLDPAAPDVVQVVSTRLAALGAVS